MWLGVPIQLSLIEIPDWLIAGVVGFAAGTLVYGIFAARPVKIARLSLLKTCLSQLEEMAEIFQTGPRPLAVEEKAMTGRWIADVARQIRLALDLK